MERNFKVGDKVRPASKKDAFNITCGFTTPNHITTKTEFEILVIVEKGKALHGEDSGLIITPIVEVDRYAFPYVWDFSRFVKVEQ